jgi:hypothetical protein
MVGGLPGNSSGFWEPRKTVFLNEGILRRHGSAGYDPSLRLQEDAAFDAKDKNAYITKIRAYLTTMPAAPLVVIKHPQITALFDLWFEAARQAGFDIATVIAVRHPQEVITSFGKQGLGASPELSSALWLKYSLLAERHTRSLPRVFVEYANLLDDWRVEIKRISTALAIDLNTRDEGAIEEFLTPNLRHERYSGPMPVLFGTDWMSAVYETLCAAAGDESWDGATLDRVYDAYRVSEHGFRKVYEEFHHFYKLNKLPPLPVIRLASEVIAMAHRRKGAWA